MRAAATEAAQDAYRANLAEAGAALPVLILQVKDYAILDPAQPGSVAQQAGAQLLLIPGSDAFGDADHGIQAIKAFVGETTGRTSPAPPGLSERELQVLRLIAHGQSNVQIARALVISPNTVQRHVSNILAKTSLANRAEAASYATRLGLVDDNN
jgi:DNA-binding CsgD family transcriptional regulator